MKLTVAQTWLIAFPAWVALSGAVSLVLGKYLGRRP